jgi:5,10-methylenetetrahydromethanopterin reductase
MIINRVGYSLGTLLSPREMLLAGKEANNNHNTHSIWVPESWGREAFSSLGALSQVTDRVKLGTSIVSIYSRSASTIAMSAATVDILSNRRMMIGLGASTPVLAENWHGLKFENPVRRMKEYIECIRLILKGELVNYNGNFCKIKNFKLAFRPKRRKIPIFLAAVNQKMILLSASIGDGLVLYLRPEHEIRNVVSTIRSMRPHRDFEIACVFITAVSDKNPEKGRDRAAKTVAFYVAVGRYYNKFLAENGFRNEVRNITDEYNSRGLNAASKLVTDKMLRSLAIYGSREDCIKALKKFMSTGISLPIIQINPLEGIEGSFRETLTIFNGNV